MMYSPLGPLGMRSSQEPGPRFGPCSTLHAQTAVVGFTDFEPGRPCCAARGVHSAASQIAYCPSHIFRPLGSRRCEAGSAASAAAAKLKLTTRTASQVLEWLIDMDDLLS